MRAVAYLSPFWYWIKPQCSIACFFHSLDSSFQATVLCESTSNSTFTVVQTTHELSNIIAWRLIIIECFVFSHPGHCLLYSVPLRNRNHLCSQELPLCTLLGSLMPRHNVHYLPVLECTCGVWELQVGWTAVRSVTHWTCQVKTDKRFSSNLLTCNKTTY